MADIGFIGLGQMAASMARRLVEAEHQLVVFDTRAEVVNQLVALGARPPRRRDRSPITPRRCWPVSRRCKPRSTARSAADSPARSGARLRWWCPRPPRTSMPSALSWMARQGVLHRREARHGADHETGQQPACRHHPSGATHASRDKFPRAILPRTFDYGFANRPMVKDVRLCLQEAQAAGLSTEITEAVGRLWDLVLRETGPDSHFTSVIKAIEAAAGVVVGNVVMGTEEPR